MSDVPQPIRFLTYPQIMEIHGRMIDLYGGISGLRDEALLDSALAQPEAAFGGQYLHQDLFEMAAAYVFHIAMNHTFLDGNKRTALAAGLTFLDLNGYEVEGREIELAEVVLEMITERRDKRWLAQQLRSRARPR